MIKSVLTTILLSLALCASAQEPLIDQDCLLRMRKGVFIPEHAENMEVIRTSKEHVEVYNEGDSKVFLEITWENDSTYVLTMKRAVNAVACLDKGQKIRTTITGCSGDRYMTYTTSEGCGSSQDIFLKKM